MNPGNLSIQHSGRLYTALLSLYPPRFRIRFAPEMLQVFRDCCHEGYPGSVPGV